MRRKKALYNVFTNLLLQLVTIIYGFIVPKIIISHFGSDINGLTSSITQFLAYISLLESGFGPVVKAALYKPIADKKPKEIAKILKYSERFFRKISLFFVFYIGILCIIFPLFINSTFETGFTISLIIIIGISTFAEYFFGMTYRLYLQAEQKTYVISIIQIATYILNTIAIIAISAFGASIIVIKLISSLIFILRPIIQNVYVRRKYKINLNIDNSEYRLSQKWDGLAQHIASVIHSNTDITILTIFSTLAEVSVYSVYHLVVNGLKKIIQSFSNGIDSSFGDMIAKKEIDNLRKKFATYEVIYFSIVAILFSCAIYLITPFITLYTIGVNDVNYIRPVFGYLIVISEYIWAIRLPYSSITLAAGNFKKTRKGAWIEALLNIVVSIIAVQYLGIIGVALGTIAAMTVRTIEFAHHANKYILKRNISETIKKVAVTIVETSIIVLFANLLPLDPAISYFNWIVKALITLVVAALTIVLFNVVFYRKDVKYVAKIFKQITKRIHRK